MNILPPQTYDNVLAILYSANNYILLDDEMFQEFTKTVLYRYNNFATSSYSYLVQMYPVHFMHIAFYETYLEFRCGSLNLLDFVFIFKPCYKQIADRYCHVISMLYKNVKEFNVVDVLSNILNNLSFSLN